MHSIVSKGVPGDRGRRHPRRNLPVLSTSYQYGEGYSTQYGSSTRRSWSPVAAAMRLNPLSVPNTTLAPRSIMKSKYANRAPDSSAPRPTWPMVPLMSRSPNTLLAGKLWLVSQSSNSCHNNKGESQVGEVQESASKGLCARQVPDVQGCNQQQ